MKLLLNHFWLFNPFTFPACAVTVSLFFILVVLMEISVNKHNISFLLFIFTGNLTEMCGAAKFVHDITYKM